MVLLLFSSTVAPSGDQIMLRPGVSWISRTFSPRGSFHTTRRLTQRRGPVMPAAAVNDNGCRRNMSGCLGISDPLLNLGRQGLHSRSEVNLAKRVEHETRASVGPASRFQCIEPWSGGPGSICEVFEQSTVAAMVADR